MLTLFLNSLFKSRMYKVSFFNFKLSMHGYGRSSDKWSLIMTKFFWPYWKCSNKRNVKYDFKIFQINLCWSFFFVFMAIFLWGLSYFSIMYQLWFLWDQLIHKRLKLLRSFAHKCHGQIWTYIIGHACIPEIWPFLVCHLLQWIFVSYIESKLCYVEI